MAAIDWDEVLTGIGQHVESWADAARRWIEGNPELTLLVGAAMGLAWLALVGYVGLRFTTSSSPAESLADDTDEWARPVEERRPEFKSVSEQIIADTLDNLGVRWQYESELQLDGERFFPDFYLPEKDAYVEFWGMPDDFDYERRMRYKMARYHRAGVRFLSIYASHLWPSGTNSPPDKQRLRWILERKIEELQ